MMKQFFAFKDKYPDAVLLFRCGDFYETYGEDAVVAARILGITLTKRSPIMLLTPICRSSSVQAGV